MHLEELVNKYYRQLKPNDIHVWNYISSHKQECCNLTIEELATRCNVSSSSILRFSQKISLKGYSELKFYLKLETEESPIDNDILNNFCDSLRKSIKEYRKHDFSSICKLIYKSKKVFLYGTGSLQRAVAQEMRRVFLTGNEHFYVIEGVDEISALSSTLTNEDLVILISLKGESDNAQYFAKQLDLKGVPFATITGFEENSISRLSEESIYVNASEINLGNGIKYQVTDSYFILVNILFLNYMIYKKDMENVKSSIE